MYGYFLDGSLGLEGYEFIVGVYVFFCCFGVFFVLVFDVCYMEEIFRGCGVRWRYLDFFFDFEVDLFWS